jgi:AraC-like DNA-binding protein
MTGMPNLLPEAPDPAALIEEALRLVHLSGAVFLRGEFAAPWAFASMGPREYAAALRTGTERLALFHVVLEGSCRVQVESGDEVVASAGEAILLPYGDRHVMGDTAADSAPVPVGQLLPPAPWTNIPMMRQGPGSGPSTRVLCGYLHCEDFLFHPLLRALPPLIHFRPTSAPAAEWLRASARYTLAEAAKGGPGDRLPELLVVDCLRQYIEAQPDVRTGWLAALRDPVLGRALALLHASPAEGWTVTRLARRVGVSRSVLGARFTAVLGAPPMRYLAQWRLQLAAHLLRSTAGTLAEIAGRVGYESEAAFSRAFKRRLGQAPAAWRAHQSDGEGR